MKCVVTGAAGFIGSHLVEGLVAAGDAYPLAAILERFFGLYVSVNGFTRLTATIEGRIDPLMRWPARAGDRVLL